MSGSLLITGAGGWLGAAIADRLRYATERPMHVIAVLGPNDPNDAVRRWEGVADVRCGDLLDPSFTASLPKAEHVIHTAAVIHAHGTRRFEDNLALTKAAWTLCAPGGTYTFISSNSAVGVGALDAYECADERCAPVGGYGRSKYESELYIRRRAAADGVRAIVLRACWFYGANPPERQQRFQQMAAGGRFPLVRGGRLRRSVSYTGDLADAALRSFKIATYLSPCYWVVDAAEYSMYEIVAARGSKRRMMGIYLPRGVARLAALVDGVLQRAGRYNQSVHVLGELADEIYIPQSLAAAHREALGLSVRDSLIAGVAIETATAISTPDRP